ncbi:hypothetical protein roselon_02751 [Roseibacterium elongatum DSM 19469]|uniref:Uncharacterized protein n=1 Tax=Roseicyclus elongatus DSM 19469 TaxID=1294273 RepID=W8SR98_9RHOB|nr:DUF4169 family protein [Roseibacterium elongatum]AHM05050.1 hypothetical protein roselon_02751 [Roseibacterium elongatum DSM 19469]
MSGKIVNLSRARKTRARDDKRRQADANAARFGRNKAERDLDQARTGKEAAHLDAHRRDGADEE